MKFKRIIPYLLAGMSVSMNSSNASAQTISAPEVNPKLIAKVLKSKGTSDLLALAEHADVHFHDLYSTDLCLNLKAENLCNVYMDNMLDAQQRLAPYIGKRGYRNAVRQELPGAPVGLHCVYGQYTQLNRALDELGDTLTIVPSGARASCAEFKTQMRKKYTANNGFENCIFEGKMYESDSAYMAALDEFISRKHATTDSAIAKYEQQFAQHNFSVDAIDAGSMLIVPRTPGNKRKFHMIMYVGRGRIENGKFIPDNNGKPVFTAHNRERIGYLFDAWDTRNVFAANIQQIAQTKYKQELARIESMPRNQLIQYILAGNSSVTADQLNQMPIYMLQKIARDKYFKGQIPHTTQNPMPAVAQNTTVTPLDIMARNAMSHTI